METFQAYCAQNCNIIPCFINGYSKLWLHIYDFRKPFFYFNPAQFNNYSYQIPTSMLQNTLSDYDCQSTTNALQWFKDNVNSSALLLTHTAFYGWALLTLNRNQVINYGFDDPSQCGNDCCPRRVYTNIPYMVGKWTRMVWATNFALSFHEVYQSGKIAIYSYYSSN